MKPVTVVVAVSDPLASATLTDSLRAHFRIVIPAERLDEVRLAILKNRADVVVVDLESTAVDAISSLLGEFSALSIVCIHRLADDRLWSSALTAGALDCCHPSDVRGIVMAVNRQGTMVYGHAAA